MNILIFGKDGQLGKAFHVLLESLLPALDTPPNIQYIGRSECNLTDAVALNVLLYQFKPKLIINTSAYTAVDKAETDSDEAFAVNTKAPEIMAEYAADYGATFLHYSTDYVFDGLNGSYSVNDPVNPVQNNYYALTKALGESSAITYENHCIIRTSFCKSNIWPYEFAFEDQFTSRDKVDIIAPMIDKKINSSDVGIFHIGTERKSVFDLAKTIRVDVKPSSRLLIKNVTIPYDTSLI
jgi:dTDP-4-dehydrorhamnose reductase